MILYSTCRIRCSLPIIASLKFNQICVANGNKIYTMYYIGKRKLIQKYNFWLILASIKKSYYNLQRNPKISVCPNIYDKTKYHLNPILETRLQRRFFASPQKPNRINTKMKTCKTASYRWRPRANGNFVRRQPGLTRPKYRSSNRRYRAKRQKVFAPKKWKKVLQRLMPYAHKYK